MSDPTAPNLIAAVAIGEELIRSGVRHAVVCPGGRSAPLAVAFGSLAGLRDWVVTDERSAGFFALGMARELSAPVAVVCTSGTAAANLLPAVAEASLSQVPLVVITADRPPEVRDFGAPQTIDQVRLYGTHVRWSVDAPPPSVGIDLERYYRVLTCRAVATAAATPSGPVHVNLPLREPLVPSGALPPLPTTAGTRPAVSVVQAVRVPSASDMDALATAVLGEERGLIACGPRTCADAADVATLAERLGWPLIADPLSGLRFHPATTGVQADGYDLLCRDEGFRRSHRPDVVLQLGALPVSKPFERLLTERPPGRHVIVSPGATWPDPLHVATDLIDADTAAVTRVLLSRAAARETGPWMRSWRRSSATVRDALAERLAAETELFEGKVYAELLTCLPDDAVLQIGNSMPVRDLDTFCPAGAARVSVTGNRGANGIDGVLSTALGAAAVGERPVVLAVGDLSFLHDAGGLQIAARHGIDALVVVVDNDGGGVFSFLPQAEYGELFERHFGTPHGLDLGRIAEASGARVRPARDWPELREAVCGAFEAPGLDIVWVRSDRRRNARRHAEHVEATLARLRAVRLAEAAA